jgi:hypothetical protein
MDKPFSSAGEFPSRMSTMGRARAGTGSCRQWAGADAVKFRRSAQTGCPLTCGAGHKPESSHWSCQTRSVRCTRSCGLNIDFLPSSTRGDFWLNPSVVASGDILSMIECQPRPVC